MRVLEVLSTGEERDPVELESIKEETSSMLFVFKASCIYYLRICGLPGVSSIGENVPNDFS